MFLPYSLKKPSPTRLKTLLLGLTLTSALTAPHWVLAANKINSVNSSPTYSNNEGSLDQNHDQELNRLRYRFVTDATGQVNAAQLKSLVEFLQAKRAETLESVRMSKKVWLINERNIPEEKANQNAIESITTDTEAVAAFDFPIAQTQDLINSLGSISQEEARERAETILLYLSAVYTPNRTSVYTPYAQTLQNFAQGYYRLPVNDLTETQASNLIQNGHFLNQEEIRRLRQKGTDISAINPPSSAFWNDNEIEKYDPADEKFMGQTIFPPQEIKIPTFTYKRMGSGTIKIKATWADNKELDQNGKPTKKSVSLRMGREVHTSVVASQLARIVGFNAIPTTYRDQVRLELGDLSYEAFIAEWKNAHGSQLGSVVSFLERIPGKNAVILHNVSMEAYPDSNHYKKIGPFRMARNGFNNRREYRSLFLYGGLIELQDTADRQVRLDAQRQDEKSPWKPLLFISDTGYSMSSIFFGNPGAPNLYASTFTSHTTPDLNASPEDGNFSTRPEEVTVKWLHNFNSSSFRTATYSDAKWLARRYSRISSKQIEAILKKSGFIEPAALLYSNKIKSRINQMSSDFDLQKDGYKPHSTLSDQAMHAQFPDYIDDSGYLTERAEQYGDNRVPILGDGGSPLEQALIAGSNYLQDNLHQLLQPNPNGLAAGETISLGEFHTDIGLQIGGKRAIHANYVHGPDEKRFLVTDTYTVSIPIGMIGSVLQTPIAAYYVYEYKYFHSYMTLAEANRKDFLGSVLPWSIYSIKRNLAPGEELKITHSVGGSLGYFRIAPLNELQLSASLGGNATQLHEVTITRTMKDFIEITDQRISSQALSTGADLVALFRVGMNMGYSESQAQISNYRFDFLNTTPEQQDLLQQAYRRLVLQNDPSEASRLAPGRSVQQDSKNGLFRIALLFWDWVRSNEAQTTEFSNTTGPEKAEGVLVHNGKNQALDLVFTQRFMSSHGRGADGVWQPTSTTSQLLLSLFGLSFSRSEQQQISLETIANADRTGFSEVNLAIDLDLQRNWSTRKDFEDSFLPYFNRRSGPIWSGQREDRASNTYFNYSMPKEIDHYSPLHGTMHWQVRARGLQKLLNALKSPSEREYFKPIPDPTQEGASQVGPDDRDKIRDLITAIEKPLASYTPQEKRKELLAKKTEDLMTLLRIVLGDNANRVGWLRRWIPDQDLWAYTQVSAPLEAMSPVLMPSNEVWLYAPEIGHYQGPSYMQRAHFTTLPGAHFDYTVDQP